MMIDPKERKRLQNYLSQPLRGYALCALAFAFGGFLILWVNAGVFLSILLFIILSCICFGLFATAVHEVQLRCLYTLNQLEASGQLPQALAEFAAAQSCGKDAVRLGTTFLFGRRTGNVFASSEVIAIYYDAPVATVYAFTQKKMTLALANMSWLGSGVEGKAVLETIHRIYPGISNRGVVTDQKRR